MGTKVVFFGVLRFLSSMRSVVSGTLQIETVFHVVTTSNNTILLCMLSTNESRLILLVVIAVFFGSNSQRINIDILSCPLRFYSKEVVVL